MQRKREHDAFLCYNYDTDFEKALDILGIMEEKYQLKLYCHQRDFQLGVEIIKNIENAVINSNHAIIILSVGFLESKWCRQEVHNCYIEHLTDPTFKLFSILTEPKDYILTFLSESRDPVYAGLFKKIKNESLNYNDPQLWEKLFRKISIGDDDDDDDYQTLEYEKINPRASWVR